MFVSFRGYTQEFNFALDLLDYKEGFHNIIITNELGNIYIDSTLVTISDTTGFVQYIEVNPLFFTMISIILTQQAEREAELRNKIWFYEEYFGRLEGEGDCKQFIPSNKALPTCKD